MKTSEKERRKKIEEEEKEENKSFIFKYPRSATPWSCYFENCNNLLPFENRNPFFICFERKLKLFSIFHRAKIDPQLIISVDSWATQDRWAELPQWWPGRNLTSQLTAPQRSAPVVVAW